MGEKIRKQIIAPGVLFYGAIIAAAIVIFIGTYGFRILNPMNIELYQTRGDSTQHYYGWVAFRNGNWTFPLGLTNYGTYPDYTSVIFTDSIPLLAIFFKVFRSVLPMHFQYFGMFTLMCYILQAVIAARIVNRFCDNKIYTFVSTMLFLFVPILIHRTFGHEALGAQFILLYMLESIVVAKDIKLSQMIKRVIICAILSAGIHMYYLLICGILLLGVCLIYMQNKEYRECFAVLLIYLAVAAVVVWIEGGFSSRINATEASGYGAFNANINSLINPLGKSIILKDMPIYLWGQGDGTAYLGLGIIIMLLCSILIVLFSKFIKKTCELDRDLIIPLIVVSIISFVYAIFPVITFNDKLLVEIELASFLMKMVAPFRCNGRTMWIVVYIVMLAVIVIVYKYMNRYLAIIFVSIASIIQIVDVSGYLTYKYNVSNNIELVDSHVMVDEFDTIIKPRGDEIKHIVVYTKSIFERGDYSLSTDVYAWALENGKTVNYIYLARDEQSSYDKRLQDSLNNLSYDTIYIFDLNDMEVCEKYGLKTTTYGRYIFGEKE